MPRTRGDRSPVAPRARRRDHYVAVGRDADAIAAFYFRSSSAVRHWSDGDGRTPYLAINKKMAAEVMRACLLVQRRRLEIYSLDGARWVLSRRGSPGNISAFEEECLRDGELPPDASTTIAAVRLGRTAGSKGYSGNARLVGVCFADGARAARPQPASPPPSASPPPPGASLSSAPARLSLRPSPLASHLRLAAPRPLLLARRRPARSARPSSRTTRTCARSSRCSASRGRARSSCPPSSKPPTARPSSTCSRRLIN